MRVNLDGTGEARLATGIAAALMLARLGWWAGSLRRARDTSPYAEAVA